MLKVHARELGNVAILSLQGQIVTGATESLRDAVGCQSGVGAVVLDFARVSTVDAGGLGVMLELRSLAHSRGIGFKLMNVSKLVGRVLEMTRLDSVFEIVSGVEPLPVAARARTASAMDLARCS